VSAHPRKATSGLALAALLGAAEARAAGSYQVHTFSGTLPHGAPHLPGALSEQDQANLRLKPLVAAGDPPIVVAGQARAGVPFFSVGVRHGLTGVLTADVRAHGWVFQDKPLMAGQPVYGVPMSGSNGAGVVWCAPIHERGGDGPHWRAICLPQNDGRFAWIEANPAMMPLNLAWIGGLEHTATEPQVVRQTVDLPPMTLSYAFAGWNSSHWLKLDVRIDWGEGPHLLHTILVPPSADGTVDLRVMGGEIVLQAAAPDNTAVTVEVRTAPHADALVAY
jgi:hypothetical protein